MEDRGELTKKLFYGKQKNSSQYLLERGKGRSRKEGR